MVEEPKREGSENPRYQKFIQTKNGDIYFGSSSASHSDILNDNHLLRSEVVGGGRADMVEKRLYGASGNYGKYDPELIRDAWSDWTLE